MDYEGDLPFFFPFRINYDDVERGHDSYVYVNVWFNTCYKTY